MKKVMFGIALILFALLLHIVDPWIPIFGAILRADSFRLLLGLAGVIIAGVGAFQKDE